MKLFCHSRIVRGIDYLLETIRFDDLLLQTDVVITGEGQLDTQSFQGKVIAGIYAHTLPKHIPLLAIVGRNKLTDSQIPSDYFQVYPLSDMSEPLVAAILFLLQPPQAGMRGRRRQVHRARQFDIAQASIQLQGAQQAFVHIVEDGFLGFFYHKKGPSFCFIFPNPGRLELRYCLRQIG